MPSIQVKNVPADIHAALQKRAKASGKSLQEFLQAELKEIAERTTREEIFAQAKVSGASFTFDEAVEAIHAERKSD